MGDKYVRVWKVTAFLKVSHLNFVQRLKRTMNPLPHKKNIIIKALRKQIGGISGGSERNIKMRFTFSKECNRCNNCTLAPPPPPPDLLKTVCLVIFIPHLIFTVINRKSHRQWRLRTGKYIPYFRRNDFFPILFRSETVKLNLMDFLNWYHVIHLWIKCNWKFAVYFRWYVKYHTKVLLACTYSCSVIETFTYQYVGLYWLLLFVLECCQWILFSCTLYLYHWKSIISLFHEGKIWTVARII
jgi:hypothetical protein